MSVKFEDYSVKVTEAMDGAIEEFLYKGSSVIQAAVQRNQRADTSGLRGKWDIKVDMAAKEATIGNPEENAIWEEFGTGEHSEGSVGGRAGAWYVPVEKATGKKKPSYNGKVIVVYGKNGQAFYKTNGKSATHAFQKAYDSKKKTVQKLAEKYLKDKLK